jgi:hypothetical protein
MMIIKITHTVKDWASPASYPIPEFYGIIARYFFGRYRIMGSPEEKE